MAIFRSGTLCTTTRINKQQQGLVWYYYSVLHYRLQYPLKSTTSFIPGIAEAGDCVCCGHGSNGHRLERCWKMKEKPTT